MTRAAALVALTLLIVAPSANATTVYRVDHVTDGDTIVLRNGQRVRLVQIDTPEVFFGTECYGKAASTTTKRLLPDGTRVHLLREPRSDSIDQYGRLLRYVVRVGDGVNINLHLVRLGAAAPWFYDRQRGRYAAHMDTLVREAQEKKLGLWGACPHTHYDPYAAIETRR